MCAEIQKMNPPDGLMEAAVYMPIPYKGKLATNKKLIISFLLSILFFFKTGSLTRACGGRLALHFYLKSGVERGF